MKLLYQRLNQSVGKVFWICFFCAFGILLLQPPVYVASATFKQAMRKPSSMEGFKDFFKQVSLADAEGSALSLMRSKRIVRAAAQDLGLQFSVSYPSIFKTIAWYIVGNLSAELRMSLPDLDQFIFKRASYSGEKKHISYLRFFNQNEFEVLDREKQRIAQGKIGQSVAFDQVIFTLEKAPENLSLTSLYRLEIKPWMKCVEKLQQKLTIKTDKSDKSLLLLTFSHKDRHIGSAFLNCLMHRYRSYLKEENEEMAREECLYLEKRQEELCHKLDKTLEEHVDYLQKNLGEEGFLSLSQEVELFSAPKEEYHARLLDIDIELKRLEKDKNTRLARGKETTHSSGPKNDEPGATAQSTAYHSSFPYQKKQEEYEKKLLSLDLGEKKYRLLPAVENAPKVDFEWANLEMTETLYLNYNREIDDIQAKLRRLRHIRSQMQEETFELSSLGHVLTDRLSSQLIERASQLMLQLQDTQNTGSKEHERLKEMLSTQKSSLAYHIDQMVELEKINLKVIEEKLSALQGSSIALIKQEKELIQEKLGEIRQKMALFPDKWRKENQLRLKAELSRRVIEGMTQFMESKNVTRHLYHVESKVVDSAFAALKPEPPHLLLLSLLVGSLVAGGQHAFQRFKEGTFGKNREDVWRF